MSDWTTIANSTIAEGEPIRASTHLALRDNPIAIAEGRPNAPRVSPWAMAGVAVSTGSTIRYLDPSIVDQDTTDFRIAYAVALMNDGTVTVEWTAERTGGTGGARTQLYRDRSGTSAAQGVEESDGSATTHSRTVTIEPGDVIYLDFRMQDSGATGLVKDFTIKTSGGLLYPMPPWFRYGSAPT